MMEEFTISLTDKEVAEIVDAASYIGHDGGSDVCRFCKWIRELERRVIEQKRLAGDLSRD